MQDVSKSGNPQGLEPNNPEQEARVLDNLVKWIETSEIDADVGIRQVILVLRGVSRRLRGIDTRGGMGYE